MPASAIPFEAASHMYLEKFNTVGGANANAQPGTAQKDISPPNNQVQSYGYLRSLWIHMTTATAATGAVTGGYNPDAIQNIIQQISLTDPNGAEIYGGPTFSGYHAYLAQKYGGYRAISDPSILPNFSVSTTSPSFALRVPLEMNPLSGFGSLPNFDAQSPYKLKNTLNTTAGIFLTAPTTANPQLQFDYYIECWTLPEPVNKITRQPQQIAPVGLGNVGGLRNGATVQHWTIQTPTVTSSSSQSIAAIRKGNIVRTWVLTARGALGARVAISNLPNPLTFLWDGAPLQQGVNPVYHVERFYSENPGQAGSTQVAQDLGVIALSYHDPGALDIQSNANDKLGWQHFIGTVQSSRIEWSGTFGANITALDVLTNDVNFVDLTGSPYSFGFGDQLQAPAQPANRS
jgi:hypothetical protein